MIQRRCVIVLGVATALLTLSWGARAEAPADAGPGQENVLPTGEWADVLSLVDPDKDAPQEGKQKTWERKGKMLFGSSTGGGPRAITLPVMPKGNYELEVKFILAGPGGTVYVFLPTGSSAVALALCNGKSGLDAIGGERAEENETGRSTTFRPGRSYTINVKVELKDKDVTLTVTLDGEALTSWTGKQSALVALYQRHKKHFGLCVEDAAVAFGSLRVKVLSGAAYVDRPKAG